MTSTPATRALRVVLAALLLPLASGAVIVTYQDALMTHLPARVAITRALRAGELPLVNPYQSCGQPLAGNPNFGTFFPDTVLLLVLPAHVAFGFRFALTALLGFMGARRLARAEGFARGAAEAAAWAFVLSGVFVSTWRFFNAGLALALAPWVIAATVKVCRRAAEGRPLRSVIAELALAAGLSVLAGEPVVTLLTGVVALVRTACAVLERREGARRIGAALAAAAGLAALLAAPQIAATLQMYQGTARSRARFSYGTATSTSVHPVRLLEQGVPYAFGRPDLTGELGFQAHQWFDGHSPYLWTLHLGWPVVTLVVLFARPGARGERWWWLTAATASVLSLGYLLPGARALFPLLSLGGRLRFPVKWWYVIAIALVPLVAAAAQRMEDGGRPSRRRWALAVASLLALLALAAMSDLRTPMARVILALDASFAIALLAAAMRAGMALRFAAALLLAVPLAAAAGPLVAAMVDRPPAPPPTLGGGRVFERVVDADPHPRPGLPPVGEGRTRDVFRRATAELWAVAGGVGGIEYAFDRDPDGSYFDGDRVVRKAVDDLPWPERAPALRRAGVRYVVASEDLAAPYVKVRTLGDRGTRLFALDGPAPRVTVTSAGGAAAGRVTAVSERPSHLAADVDLPAGGEVVWSRTFFPAWRASVDGVPAVVSVAEGHLVGVRVPAGTHRVEVWWPEAPVWAGTAAALLGALISAWCRWGRAATGPRA